MGNIVQTDYIAFSAAVKFMVDPVNVAFVIVFVYAGISLFKALVKRLNR